MVRKVKVTNVKDIRSLVDRASASYREIGVHDALGQIADAKSILGMMRLDYSKPVQVVCEDERELNRICRVLAQ